MIKKAFILGAGLGTRLRPLTFILPKPLIPINPAPSSWISNLSTNTYRSPLHSRRKLRGIRRRCGINNKPIIEYAFGHLKTAGVQYIIINTHHLAEEYTSFIGNGKKFDLNVSYSYEPQLLDTGGGLKKIERFIGNNTFIMYNGDIITDVDLKKMIQYHNKNGCIATLLISKRHRPLHVLADKNYNIQDIGSGVSYLKKKSIYAFCGIHILEPDIFKYIPPGKAISIITVYKELLKKGLPIKGYLLGNSKWQEIGDIPTYKRLFKNKNSISKTKLTPHGSSRTFTRIKTNLGNIISMHYNPKKRENNFYTNILFFLQKLNINVPKLIYNDKKSHRLIVEDLGNKTLYSTCKKHINIKLYKKAIDEILNLHLKGKKIYNKVPFSISKKFNYKLYIWESSYFEKNCLLDHFKIGLNKNSRSNLHKDFIFLARKLSKEPQCLIHRDFQSKNIMVKNNEIYLIDFQGMRFGLPHYDLASLLYDPYMNFSEKTRNNLYNYYLKQIIHTNNFIEIYRYAAIQRLMQALGAYGYLGLKSGKEEFLSYIPKGVKNLNLLLKNITGLQELKQIVSKISSIIPVEN